MLSRVRLALAGALLAATLISVTPAMAADAGSPGAVRFLKRTDPSFDRFMDAPTPAFKAWMNEKFWRSEVFTPYFDAKNAWYRNGLVYLDVYAVYRDAATAQAHPEWILRDTADNKLYIPFGCDGTSCPQYAGDITNPAFRQAFIDYAKASMAQGYKGIWLDDVNLEFQVSDASGRHVDAVDPRTGKPMTALAWREAMAGFMEEIRAALPAAELLHNSIWYAGQSARDRDPSVVRQIAAADYINIERGVNDAGLTGGTGEWSLNALFGYVDRIHAAGKSVILDAGDATPAGREYNLAAYYLISIGRDAVGLGVMTPENWWTQYDRDLGAPAGGRTWSAGLHRRDFAGGIVLLNDPGAAPRTVTLAAPMTTTSGQSVTKVTLAGGSAAILHAVGGGTPPVLTPEPVATPAPAPKPAPLTPAPEIVPAPTATTPVATPPATVRVRVRRAQRRTVVVEGRVAAAARGDVRVRVQRAGRKRWHSVATRTAGVDRDGGFRAALARLAPGRYRVSAAYLPGTAGRSILSAPLRFRIHG
jgi:hypothetical protein